MSLCADLAAVTEEFGLKSTKRTKFVHTVSIVTNLLLFCKFIYELIKPAKCSADERKSALMYNYLMMLHFGASLAWRLYQAFLKSCVLSLRKAPQESASESKKSLMCFFERGPPTGEAIYEKQTSEKHWRTNKHLKTLSSSVASLQEHSNATVVDGYDFWLDESTERWLLQHKYVYRTMSTIVIVHVLIFLIFFGVYEVFRYDFSLWNCRKLSSVYEILLERFEQMFACYQSITISGFTNLFVCLIETDLADKANKLVVELERFTERYAHPPILATGSPIGHEVDKLSIEYLTRRIETLIAYADGLDTFVEDYSIFTLDSCVMYLSAPMITYNLAQRLGLLHLTPVMILVASATNFIYLHRVNSRIQGKLGKVFDQIEHLERLDLRKSVRERWKKVQCKWRNDRTADCFRMALDCPINEDKFVRFCLRLISTYWLVQELGPRLY